MSMATFQKVKLGDVCEVGDGAHASLGRTSSGVMYLTSKNFKNGTINLTNVEYISEETYSRHFRSDSGALTQPVKGDILFSIIGSIGSPYIVRIGEKYGVSSSVSILRPNEEMISSMFLFYWMRGQAFQNAINGIKGGVAQSYVSLEMIKSLPVCIPPLSQQKMIASVLSAYDELIENNEKRIKTLEEMAQLLYTEWFVKFKFPGNEKVKMVDSGTEYGMIPEGWEVKKLSEVANIVRGRSYSSEEIDDFVGDYYLVNLKSFNREGGFRFDGAKYFLGQINNNQLLKAGDVVVAVTDMTNDRAVIARPARIPEIDGKVTFSADVVKISSDILPSSFIYELLSSYHFTETTKQKANGANVLHLKPAAILEFIALIPDAKSLKEFDAFCKPAINEVDKLLKQNDILTKTRDLLIPQLVTGRRELKEI